MHGTEYINKKIKPDGSPIGVGGLYYLGKLSNLPPKDTDFLHGWTVGEIVAQHKIDRPGTMSQ